MEFTFNAYVKLIELLKKNEYQFCGFNEQPKGSFVIFRHDIDFSPAKAFDIALIEQSVNVKSTYFVLLRTDFYNVFSRQVIKIIRDIQKMGHSIGLHFDEREISPENWSNQILREAAILSDALELPIKSVSMHCPSPEILNTDLQISDIVNSYSHYFMRECKYLSDSRHNWREDPLAAISSGKYPHMQILTHPFWYSETESSLKDAICKFCLEASYERYLNVKDNIRDLENDLSEKYFKSIINNKTGGMSL